MTRVRVVQGSRPLPEAGPGTFAIIMLVRHLSMELHYRKNDLILIMTPEKQDKSLELSKHWSADSTPAKNEVIMKTTYPVKSVKCDKICSNC